MTQCEWRYSKSGKVGYNEDCCMFRKNHIGKHSWEIGC